MLRRLIYITILVGLSYWGYTSWQSSIEEGRQEAEAQARAEKLKDKITDVALKYGATTDWPSRLASDERFRMSPVLTAELQDLWTSGKPILFIGSVSDIVRTDSENVLLILAYGSLDQSHMFLSTTLRVKVQCANLMASPLLAAARSPSRMRLHSEVAIVAEIGTIEVSTERDEEGKSAGVLTGIGKCIDVVPIPEPTYWWPKAGK